MGLKNLIFLPVFFLVFSLYSQNSSDPYRSIIVSKDGKGHYTGIQQAIDATRDLGPGFVEIYIKNGTYNEKLTIPTWKHKLRLIGEDRAKTIITNGDYSGKVDSSNQSPVSTFTSFTLLVSGDEIEIENLTIKNSSCGQGQAVALHVEGDKFKSENVNILGCQDTIYAATGNSRQYYKNCYIEGTTDFIFGQATALFEGCTIKSLRDSFITAAATTPDQEFGFVFKNCKLIAADHVESVYLGRPWRPFAKTVFLQSHLGKHIVGPGWDPWDGDQMFPDKQKTTMYAEYDNYGPGALTHQRVDWSKELTQQEAEKYTLRKILGGADNWNPGSK